MDKMSNNRNSMIAALRPATLALALFAAAALFPFPGSEGAIHGLSGECGSPPPHSICWEQASQIDAFAATPAGSISTATPSAGGAASPAGKKAASAASSRIRILTYRNFPGNTGFSSLKAVIKGVKATSARRSASLGVQLEYRRAGDQAWSWIAVPSGTAPITLKGLKAAKPYEFRLRMIKPAGKILFAGPWSPIRGITTKKNYNDITVLVDKSEGLPLDFVPKDLTPIDGQELRRPAADAFREMSAAAAKDGVHISVLSGYRSPQKQQETYDYYVRVEGKEKAGKRVAPIGYSEHQTGLALDISGGYEWADRNCWKYGFIACVTEAASKITGYRPEPWHLRYIGKKYAAAFVKSGLATYGQFYEEYID